jgi:hypothetical protein
VAAVCEDTFGFWSVVGHDECAFLQNVQRQSLGAVVRRD